MKLIYALVSLSLVKYRYVIYRNRYVVLGIANAILSNAN